jgi:DNA-binding transcriptional LysR family regulator
MRFTLKQLQAFVAAAQDSNVSSAAKALSLSQSAVSAAIAELESQFGRPLFDRIGKRLQLNETGKQLLPKAINLLTQAQELEQYARSGEATGNFRVGATLTIGNYLAAQLISDYMKAYPASRIQLKVANTSQIIDGMRRFEIDVGLIEGECYDPEIQALPWCDDEMVVFCAPGHVLADRREIGLADLSQQLWILREPGSGTRALFDRAVTGRLTHLNVQLELEHTEAIKRAVEAGLGIGCISRVALRDAFRRGSLVELPTPFFDLRRRFYFLLHRQRQLTQGINQFLELCRHIVE